MSDRGSPSPRRSRSRSPSPRADDNEDKKSPRVSDNEDRETSRRSRSRSPAPKAPAAPADVANPGNNLYVANLATRVGEQDLQEIFSKFGRVDKCEVIVDPVTKESRGFGFVTFEDVRDAEDAVKELNKYVGCSKRSRGGRLEWNTPNGSVDTRRPPDNSNNSTTADRRNRSLSSFTSFDHGLYDTNVPKPLSIKPSLQR
ncbi:putative RNA-binding protein C25G10.01 [Phytophthora nicotianae]|uniref:RNA-binding protein C25G10.01 n=1 Tax=Phytophthora nicotianae TaxID=4792 RepID=A0A0W8BNI5_PHYNI|nr:putative RNA-binding protein C25G10.01 [Phytophthora nicotianae]